jgi:hypothetical protein
MLFGDLEHMKDSPAAIQVITETRAMFDYD